MLEILSQHRQLILGALTVSNLLSFGLFVSDKRRAVNRRRRIPENTLLLTGAVGGLGACLAMNLFRHKTRHPRFQILMGLAGAASLVLIILLTVQYLQ